MKRKVKFQEGGAVEGESPRNRQLREMMERSGREGRRVGLAERARQREVANQAARRAAAAERAAARREVERLNPGQGAAEAERRAGRAVPERRPDFTTDPRGTTRRGAATGREMVPYREPGVPATQGGRGMVPPGQGGTPRQIPLFPSGTPRIPGPVASAARRFIPGLGALDAVSPTSLEAGAQFERENMRRAQAEAMLANLPAGPDIPTEMRNAMPARPDAAAERRAARPAPAPAPRRELTMEEIRALRSGERAPRTSEERALREGLRDLPQRREMTAEELNEREYQRILATRAAEEEAARQMGGSGNIGAASARERGEQVGPFGDYNLKKGGIVKKKAGGMIKAAPKKMMKGGVVAKPKSKTKAKSVNKLMPLKKGSMVKKGNK